MLWLAFLWKTFKADKSAQFPESVAFINNYFFHESQLLYQTSCFLVDTNLKQITTAIDD
jgi:hypothetical protein